jgi:hypothetical protein
MGLLGEAGRAQKIVIERGLTAWWIPFVTALFVALVGAVASTRRGDSRRATSIVRTPFERLS